VVTDAQLPLRRVGERGALPSDRKRPRSWRTRWDPLAEVWASEIEPPLVRDVLESAFLFPALDFTSG
jgi:hypothetical protein